MAADTDRSARRAVQGVNVVPEYIYPPITIFFLNLGSSYYYHHSHMLGVLVQPALKEYHSQTLHCQASQASAVDWVCIVCKAFYITLHYCAVLVA